MTTTTRQSQPATFTLTWTRQQPGVYTAGGYAIRREDTTGGMNRASNPMWHVYVEGQVGRLYRCATLADAKAKAAFHVTREAAKPAAVEEAPATTREARTWNATASGTHQCAGACGQVKPAKSFPTTSQAGRRGVVCRSCRDAAKSAA